MLAFCLIPEMRHAPAVPPPASRLLPYLSVQGGRAQREALADAGEGIVMVSLPVPTPEPYGKDGFHPGALAVAMIAGALVEEVMVELAATARAA